MLMELIFVKGVARGATPADVEVTGSFGRDNYKLLAQAIFPRINWTETGAGRTREGEVLAMIEPDDTALKVTLEGQEDLSALLLRLTSTARTQGVVTIDVGGFAVLDC